MIDHTGIIVSNLKSSITWYEAALAPIGYGKLMEFSKEITQSTGVAGFGETKTSKPDFWLSEATQDRPVNSPKQHIAFRKSKTG